MSCFTNEEWPTVMADVYAGKYAQGTVSNILQSVYDGVKKKCDHVCRLEYEKILVDIIKTNYDSSIYFTPVDRAQYGSIFMTKDDEPQLLTVVNDKVVRYSCSVSGKLASMLLQEFLEKRLLSSGILFNIVLHKFDFNIVKPTTLSSFDIRSISRLCRFDESLNIGLSMSLYDALLYFIRECYDILQIHNKAAYWQSFNNNESVLNYGDQLE